MRPDKRLAMQTRLFNRFSGIKCRGSACRLEQRGSSPVVGMSSEEDFCMSHEAIIAALLALAAYATAKQHAPVKPADAKRDAQIG